MQHWKFLLLGITGDLAKKKILPGIAQFAEFNQEKVQIDLIGYSRSLANSEQVKKILDDNTSSGSHVLNSVRYHQGDYTDASFFDKLYQQATKDSKLVIYMAVPPNVFLNFVENACPYNTKNIHILMEKPFGSNLQEAIEILKVIQKCKLTSKVHFLDHYLFKSESILTTAEILNFRTLKQKPLKKVSIEAREAIGVKDRAGYYDKNGALKDMMPHIFSMLNMGLTYFEKSYTTESLEEIKFENILWGQYQSYGLDTQTENSKTETYFRVQGELLDTKISIESGKKTHSKKTQITIEFEDGSILNWKIAPEKEIEYIAENGYTINLDRNKKLDHTNTFEALLVNDFSHFVTPANMLAGWWVYDKIIEIKNKNYSKPLIYKDNIYPVEFLESNNLPDLNTNLKKTKEAFSQSLDELLKSTSTVASIEDVSKTYTDAKIQL